MYTTDLCPPIYSTSFLDNLIHKPYGSYVNTILLYCSENNNKKLADPGDAEPIDMEGQLQFQFCKMKNFGDLVAKQCKYT